jgi:hypothetical protein
MATFGCLPEEVATELMTDELLLAKLKACEHSERDFGRVIDSTLMERNEKLQGELERSRAELDELQRELIEARNTEASLLQEVAKLGASVNSLGERERQTQLARQSVEADAGMAEERVKSVERQLATMMQGLRWCVPALVLACVAGMTVYLSSLSLSQWVLPVWGIAAALLLTASLAVPMRKNSRQRRSWWVATFAFVGTCVTIWSYLEPKLR